MFIRLIASAVIVLLISGLLSAQTQDISPPLPSQNAYFGWSSSTDGQTLVVGAPYENTMQGAAYVYTRNGSDWQYIARLEPDYAVTQSSPFFGYTVDVNGDTIVVGAYTYDSETIDNIGAIFIYQKDTTDNWDVEPLMITVDDTAESILLGSSLAIDGDTIVAGAASDDNEKGAVYVYSRSDGNWTFDQKLTAPDGQGKDSVRTWGDWFGFSVAIDGDIIVAGARQDKIGSNDRQGSAYVFTRSGDDWADSVCKLFNPAGSEIDYYGCSVDVSGEVVVVGAYSEENGSVYVYRRDSGEWPLDQKLPQQPQYDTSYPDNTQDFGFAVAIDADTIVTGAPRLSGGYAFMFERDDLSWSQPIELIPGGGDGYFGRSVAISGNTIFAGSPLKDAQFRNIGGVTAITLPDKIFNEFRVNTFSENQQYMPAVASSQQNEFVVVWQSKYTNTIDTWHQIAAQRYDKYGRKIGGEFVVNQTDYHTQGNPKIAMRDNGSFIVIWESYADSSVMEDIYGRLYDADCNPLTDEFRINTQRSSRQTDPDVAFKENGEFMVAWMSYHDASDPIMYWEIRTRFYNADATPKTDDLTFLCSINPSDPRITGNGKGGYFLLYGNEDHDICAAEYNGSGTFIAPVHLLTERTVNADYDAHIDLTDNSLALVYSKQPKPNSEYLNICAKKFDALFNEIVPETLLNDPNVYKCSSPSLDQFSNGNYVVTWTRKGDSNYIYDDCFARRFSPSFKSLESRQIVNNAPSPKTGSTFYNSSSDVSVINTENYAVTWSFNTDGDDEMNIMAAIGPKTHLGDFDFSGQTNITDLKILTQSWLTNEPVLDIAPNGGDGTINLLDLAILAKHWQQ
ncbi:MAG: hypothetical protein K9M75_00665 [Phycisphaerae bacterium]|nr:hypothetical protein [Phycisphaerae bacterium]